MADVQRCLQDGYSTGGTPGNGLGAVRRLSDDFDVHSTAGQGTVVCRAGRRPSRLGAPSAALTMGGDLACRRRTRRSAATPGASSSATGTARCMVADGLGHGPLAAEAADLAGAVFDAEPFDDAGAFCRARAPGPAPAAAAPRWRVAHVIGAGACGTPASATSPACWSAASGSRGLASQNGTVGLQIRKVQSVRLRVAAARGCW